MTVEIKNDPNVSIIIPCFNRRHLIRRTIDSSLEQTIDGVEVIVVDDCSTDGTSSVVKTYGTSVRLFCLKKNVGPSRARNIGLNKSNGEFVLFLDSDDYIEPNSLQHLIKSARKSDITFGPFALARYGEITSRSTPIATSCPLEFSYNWVSGHFVPPCSVLWRCSFVRYIGGWRDTALRNTDGEIVLRAMIMGARFSFAASGLGIYCQHDSPERVSKRSGRAVLHNQLEMLESLLELARSRKFEGIERVIGRSMYKLAGEAFNYDVNDIGDHALTRARDLGFRGHAGGWRHKASAKIFGLRRKLQIVRRFRSMTKDLSSISNKNTSQ
jgi:glycosyltransferase involved in cell wall biosynthesis